LEIKVMRPRETFPRMLEHKEFEVSELSLGSYVSLKGRGTCPFVAVPVALSKIFRHSCIYIRTDAGIRTPQDLRGKRVGTTQLGSTAAIFMNGMLQHEYGVTMEDIHWFIGGLTAPTQRPLIPLKLRGKIKVEFLPSDWTLEGMLESGDLDALLAIFIPSIFRKGSPCIARLFPNYYEVEQDYYRRTGIFPIMHTVVLRDDIYREHPWVARSIYRAFCEARDLAIDGLYDTDALHLSLPWLINHIEETWRVLGRISGRTGWSRTGRRWRLSASMSTNRVSRPAPLALKSCSYRTWSNDRRPVFMWRDSRVPYSMDERNSGRFTAFLMSSSRSTASLGSSC
jgi:4,5-dihydroxyphthalate decarboxylase